LVGLLKVSVNKSLLRHLASEPIPH